MPCYSSGFRTDPPGEPLIESETLHAPAEATELTLPWLAARGALGGILMGLANLVPGISGGTMLLATGVYTGFIAAIAELTTMRFRLRSLVLLGAVGVAAAGAILILAGPTKTLVVEQRWVMYSLFIGLTLGGVPLVWRLARPSSPGLWLGCAGGFTVMLVMVAAPGSEGGGDGPATTRLFLSGVAGAGAMILPGVSGGYLLLLLGQYVPILSAIDKLKVGLLGANGSGGLDTSLLLESFQVVVPVGIGVVIGVVGISNLLRLALDRFPKPTLGALLGLLLGAVVGLWPFQEGVPPEPSAGVELEPEEWPVRFFPPSGGQVAGALGLIGAGLATTLLIDGLGRRVDGDDD